MGIRREKLLGEIQRDLKIYFNWMSEVTGIPPHLRRKVYGYDTIKMCSEHLVEFDKFESEDLTVDFYRFNIPQIGARDIPFVLCIPKPMNFYRAKTGTPMRKCFVGCRFDRTRPKFTRLLEQILNYYGYRFEFTDTAFRPGQIFDTILDAIGSEDVDFSIFDNRGTEKKPNVYIELGAAYVMRKPHILLEYKDSVLPSDFHGFLTLRYSNYKQLALQFARILPTFLASNDLEPPAQRA